MWISKSELTDIIRQTVSNFLCDRFLRSDENIYELQHKVDLLMSSTLSTRLMALERYLDVRFVSEESIPTPAHYVKIIRSKNYGKQTKS